MTIGVDGETQQAGEKSFFFLSTGQTNWRPLAGSMAIMIFTPAAFRVAKFHMLNCTFIYAERNTWR